MDTPSEVYRRSDTDRVIECAVGETFGIELVENATTGFRWLLTADDLVAAVAERVRAPDPMIPGAAGARLWLMRAERPGTGALEFVLRQPWEPEAPAADRVVFNVVVAGGGTVPGRGEHPQ
jgi:inhibitor of cysteine peptidase